MVFTLLFNILLHREDAEETAQDVFVKAYKALESFKGTSKFSTWLYRIAVNAALNKKKIKTSNIVPIDAFAEDELYEDVYDLLDKCENDDRKKFVQLAVQYLKDNERICITLFYLNELQIGEIHEMTGISTSNIKILLHRGRKNLYGKLKQLLKSDVNHLI